MLKALLIAAAAATAIPASDTASLIATERAFSTTAASIGIPRAFRRYAAPGGVVFQDGRAVRVAEAYPGDAKGPGSLVWRPQVAGVARSQELGFDSGPFTLTDDKGGQVHGWFFTVWGRQADGTWRFLVDNGVVSGKGPSPIADADPTIVQPGKAGDGATALNDVQTNEIVLTSYGFGVSRSLANDAWVLREGSEAATGKAAVALAKKDPRMTYTPLAGGASADGDMAYFYGRAEWGKGRANYLRVWQRRPNGWRVAMDSLVPAPKA